MIRKRGRPRLEPERQTRRNITLGDRLACKAAEIGDGSVSEGIRRALEAYQMPEKIEVVREKNPKRGETRELKVVPLIKKPKGDIEDA